MPTSDEVLEQIERHLRVLVALTASVSLDGLNTTQKIDRLMATGLDARTIAEVIGAPLSTVAPIVSRRRRASKEQSDA